MEASSEYPKVTVGEGYAVGHLEDLGDGPGFRKVRKGLGVTAFGVNAVYLCAGGKDGYIGRDGQVPPGEEQRVRALHDLSAEQPR